MARMTVGQLAAKVQNMGLDLALELTQLREEQTATDATVGEVVAWTKDVQGQVASLDGALAKALADIGTLTDAVAKLAAMVATQRQQLVAQDKVVRQQLAEQQATLDVLVKRADIQAAKHEQATAKASAPVVQTLPPAPVLPPPPKHVEAQPRPVSIAMIDASKQPLTYFWVPGCQLDANRMQHYPNCNTSDMAKRARKGLGMLLTVPKGIASTLPAKVKAGAVSLKQFSGADGCYAWVGGAN